MSGAGMGNGLAGLAYFPSNDSDPYITLKNPVRSASLVSRPSLKGRGRRL